jgi:hypothetical protein
MTPKPTAVVEIYSAAALHIAEGSIILSSRAADSSIGIASMVEATDEQRTALAVGLLLSSLLAILAVRQGPGAFAMIALLPQQTLLMITAIGAVCFASLGHYADGYEPGGGGLFILADQLPRILFAIVHGVAAFYWIWCSNAPSRKRSKVDKIVAAASWVSQVEDGTEDELLLIPVDELRAIVEANL